MKRKLISGDERDAIHARRHLCCLQRAGVVSATKRRIRRRERQEGRREAREQA
jgi:hypothetical protein